MILLPSLQSLFIQMRFNGQFLASGTAFVVNSARGPVLLTNRHNVTGRNQETGQPLCSRGGIPNEIVIYHNRRGSLGGWVSKLEPLKGVDDLPLWIEHPTLGERADFVALPLTQLDDVELYPYDPFQPGLNFYVGPADAVSVVGFPFGEQVGGYMAIWATGFMASEPSVNYRDLPTFLIDCRSRRGQSGSPVIAYRTDSRVPQEGGGHIVIGRPALKFLGIYSGRINEQSDLGIVWKASAISELIDSI